MVSSHFLTAAISWVPRCLPFSCLREIKSTSVIFVTKILAGLPMNVKVPREDSPRRGQVSDARHGGAQHFEGGARVALQLPTDVMSEPSEIEKEDEPEIQKVDITTLKVFNLTASFNLILDFNLVLDRNLVLGSY